jgi:hypothetical protein
MGAEATFDLRPDVHRLARAIEHADGGLRFRADALAEARAGFERLPMQQRHEAAEHLAALGLKLERLTKHGAEEALAQLVQLILAVRAMTLPSRRAAPRSLTERAA